MIYQATIILLAVFLQSVPFALHAQSAPETTEADTGPATTESAGEDAHRLPFDPALVGLPGFPDPLASPEDYARAESLIESRLTTLDQQETNGGLDKTDDALEGGPVDESGEGQQQAQASRIAALRALLLTEKQGRPRARERDIGDSLANEKNQLDKIQSHGARSEAALSPHHARSAWLGPPYGQTCRRDQRPAAGAGAGRQECKGAGVGDEQATLTARSRGGSR